MIWLWLIIAVVFAVLFFKERWNWSVEDWGPDTVIEVIINRFTNHKTYDLNGWRGVEDIAQQLGHLTNLVEYF